MLYFPQLSTGSIAQYPITRTNVRRTLVNSSADGSRIAMADPGGASVKWTLAYTHLTAAELTALQQLFKSCCGRWQTFTYLDPTDNLLNWSEDLSQPAWESGPMIRLTPGVADPLSGTSAWQVINTAQTNQTMLQTLPVASSFQYCLSAYVRAGAPGSFALVANSQQQTVTATTAWTRITMPFQLNSSSDTLAVGVSLPAGCSLSLFGLQLEAQAAAGGYKKTRDIAGVYPNSRFDQDTLTATATGPNQFSVTVRIVSNSAG